MNALFPLAEYNIGVSQLGRGSNLNTRLGILSVTHDVDRANQPYGALTPLFEAIHREAELLGVEVFVFHPQTITDHVKGCSFKKGKWAEQNYFLPNVIYNRLPSRAVENTPEIAQFLRSLQARLRIKVFNQCGFLKKSQVYDALRSSLPTGLWLPTTVSAGEPVHVVELVNQWGELWLKPDEGSLGGGIYRLLREPYGITLESSDQSSVEQMSESSISDFFDGLLKKRPYLCQQGIHRAQHDLRPYDIRVLLHKNAHGKFGVTNEFVRLAEHGQIASNITAGGDGLGWKEFLTEEEQKKLRSLAIACATSIDQKIAGPIGELGLDIAIDQQRNFWFLEANSKPYLRMNPADPRTSLIAKRIVEYATYLTEKKRKPITPQNGRKPSPRVSKDR